MYWIIKYFIYAFYDNILYNVTNILILLQPATKRRLQVGGGSTDDPDEAEVRELESALERTVVNYELTFNQNNPRDMFERIRDAIEKFLAVLKQRQDEGALLKYYVGLKLNFQKAADASIVTDPPVVIQNGEVMTLTPSHQLEQQLETLLFNLLTRIDNFEQVNINFILII